MKKHLRARRQKRENKPNSVFSDLCPPRRWALQRWEQEPAAFQLWCSRITFPGPWTAFEGSCGTAGFLLGFSVCITPDEAQRFKQRLSKRFLRAPPGPSAMTEALLHRYLPVRYSSAYCGAYAITHFMNILYRQCIFNSRHLL